MRILKIRERIIFLIFTLFLCPCIIGQDLSKSTIQGPYGGDLRTRPSYGIIPDIQYQNCVKIKNLNSKRIAVAVSFPQVLTVTNNNILLNKTIDHSYSFNIENFMKTLILSSPAQSIYNFKLFDNEDSKKLRIKFGSANLKLSKTELDLLVNKYESDYLIFFKGSRSMYFRAANKYKGCQGLFSGSNINMIYASQIVYVYNLKTGKLLNKGVFPQESADIVPETLILDFDNLIPNQLSIVDTLIEERLRNNLKQSFKLLGID